MIDRVAKFILVILELPGTLKVMLLLSLVQRFPAYMAPETDITSILLLKKLTSMPGVLLFELLTGQRPFRGSEKEPKKQEFN
jgi:hypothetical protein